MKKCFKCEQTKPIGDFYDHPAMADGKLGKCKECSKVDVRTNRAKRRAYYSEYEKIRSQREERKRDASANLQNSRKKNPDQYKARTAVSNAVRCGKMKRLPCEVCGSLESEAHHEDYSKPLDVVWLCFKHHREIHGQVVL